MNDETEYIKEIAKCKSVLDIGQLVLASASPANSLRRVVRKTDDEIRKETIATLKENGLYNEGNDWNYQIKVATSLRAKDARIKELEDIIEMLRYDRAPTRKQLNTIFELGEKKVK